MTQALETQEELDDTEFGEDEPRLRDLTRFQRLMTPKNIILIFTIAAIFVLAIVPLLYLVVRTVTESGSFSLDAFARAYRSTEQAPKMAMNSLAYATMASALAATVGAALAYAVVRTNVRWKSLIYAGALTPLIVPGTLYAVAWIFLADKEIGLINVLLEKIIGVKPLNIFSIYGMSWVEGLHLMPISFLLMVAAFRSMDPSLEEAAAMSGARGSTVLRRITLPLLLPALSAGLLLIFVQALESFETPAILGLPNGTYVFTSRIYYTLQQFPADFGAAGAYSMGLLAIAVVGVLLANWLNRDRRKFQTVSGKAFRSQEIDLRNKRKWIEGGLIVYFVIAVALPLLLLVYSSFLNYYQTPSLEAFASMSFDNYVRMFGRSDFATAAKNTLILGVGAATLVTILSTIASWFIVRSSGRGRKVLDLLTFSPMIIPGMVLGVALIFVYIRVPLPIYGTLLIMLIAYTTKYIPYGTRFTSSALGQISNELEESAQTSGAGWFTTLRRIIVPLASSGVVSAWIYVVVVSFRELSSTILLYSPGRETMSILMWQEWENGRLTALTTIGVFLVVVLVTIVLLVNKIGSRFGLSITPRIDL